MVSLPRFKLVAEAACELRKSERWLRDWLKQHPVDRNGDAFYRLAGRTKLLSDGDIDRIRENLPCPSPSYRRSRAVPRTTTSAVHTSELLLTEARALLTGGSPQSSRSGSSRKSSPVSTRQAVGRRSSPLPSP